MSKWIKKIYTCKLESCDISSVPTPLTLGDFRHASYHPMWIQLWLHHRLLQWTHNNLKKTVLLKTITSVLKILSLYSKTVLLTCLSPSKKGSCSSKMFWWRNPSGFFVLIDSWDSAREGHMWSYFVKVAERQ